MLRVEEYLVIHDRATESEITAGRINISEIARETGYDRKTIRKYLAMQVPPGPQKRQRGPRIIDKI